MIDIQKMEQMHEFVTLPTSGIKKAELEARLRTVLESFREAVVQELVAGSGEPVAWAMKDAAGNVVDTITEDDRQRSMSRWADCYPHPLLLRDQLAGAVLRERERCAKVCDDLAFMSSIALAARNADGSDYYDNDMVRIGISAQEECAAAIRSGQ